MATFRKDIVWPGTYRLKDGRRLSLTRADIQHLHRRVGEMVAAGLKIPVAWNHQAVRPMSDAEILAAKARGVIGHVEAGELDEEFRLKALADVADPEDARRLPSAKFCSPEIQMDWVDGLGRKWPGLSITHVAVTGNPVNPHQEAFEPVQLSNDVWRLSLDDLERSKTMPDDSVVDTDDNGGELGKLIQALKAHGFNIPDGVDDMAKLIIAVESNDNDAVGRAPEKPADTDSDTETVSESSPMLMSLDDPKDPMKTRLLTTEREALAKRAMGLVPAGKVGRPVAEKLACELRAEPLSLTRDGKVVGGKAMAKLEAYEALDPRPFTAPAQMSHDGVIEQEPPGQGDEERERNDLRKAAKAAAERVSIKGRHSEKM